MKLSFFNTFDVSAQGKRITSFRSAKVQALLIYLVLEADTSHLRERLAVLFWPDEPQSLAKKNLRQSLYHLRKILGEAQTTTEPFLLATRQTVQFNPASDYELDVVLFQAAIARGALDLVETYYTGQLLPGFNCDSQPFAEWLDHKRHAYQQAALSALHELAERQFALGKVAISRALALARRQLDLEPWREEAHRQLMRGLALSGDRSGAIVQFDICSDVLADELGVSPASETFALFEAIRDETFPPESETTAASIPNNIPHQATPLVGRSAEIDQLLTHLHDPSTRLITIVGPGGMGKTRLALETARSLLAADAAVLFPKGVFLVELAAATSREEMIPTCATAFGFALEREPEPLQQIVNFLANKHLLLLLDNVEQLIAPPANAAEVITALLKAAPGLNVLVTSRQKLSLTGERVLPLGGLALPDEASTATVESSDAMQLFAESARRVQPTFQLTDHNAPQVANICRLAAGMPLGILLSAAWSHLLSPAEIAAEMVADIDFVAVEMPDLPARQRSMRAVFDHSWALLSQSEQQILAKLSVFRGGFTREAAQVVTGATLPDLLGLINKSLLQRDVESGRFHLHQLVRQLAANKLDVFGNGATIRTAHSRYYLRLLQTHYAAIYRQGQRDTKALLAAAHQNIQAGWLSAATRNDTDLMLSSIESIHFYFTHSGRDLEIQQLYREALARLPAGDPEFADTADETTLVRASILNRLQERGFAPDDQGTTIDIDRLFAYFQARGAQLEEAITCQHLGFQELKRHNAEQAMFFLQRQISLFEDLDATFRLTHSLAVLPTIAFRAGQVEPGLMLAQRYLALAEENGDRLAKAGALSILGAYQLGALQDYESANALFAQTTALGFDLLFDNLTGRFALMGLAYQVYVALLQGDLALAQAYSEEQQTLVAQRNNKRDQAGAFVIQALIDATTGHYYVIDAELLQATPISHVYFTPLAVRLNACGRGDTAVALSSLIAEWHLPITFVWPALILRDIPVAAFIVLEQGDPARAASLLAMGRAHPACPHGWWEIMDLVQTMDARLQAELSPAAYAEAQARGQKMDVKETAKALLDDLKGDSL